MKLPQFYSLHWWSEAPGPLWQDLGPAHDVASLGCQVLATCFAWRRQIRAGRVRKPLPVGRQAWHPDAGLSKLQPFRLELPWNKSVQGMARSWQRAKGTQMEKKACEVNRLGAGFTEGHQGILSTCFPRFLGRGSRKGPVRFPYAAAPTAMHRCFVPRLAYNPRLLKGKNCIFIPRCVPRIWPGPGGESGLT